MLRDQQREAAKKEREQRREEEKAQDKTLSQDPEADYGDEDQQDGEISDDQAQPPGVGGTITAKKVRRRPVRPAWARTMWAKQYKHLMTFKAEQGMKIDFIQRRRHEMADRSDTRSQIS